MPNSASHRTRQRLTEMADSVTAVSKHTAQSAKRELNVDPVVIYNGVDADRFHSDHPRPEVAPSSQYVLFVGSMVPRKRPTDVIRVAENVPDNTFVIVGDGPLENQVKRRASELDNVVYRDWVRSETLRGLFANAETFLFPTENEGCPLVVLEAMASETSVVGYRSTSMPELVEDGETGRIVPHGDTEALSDAVVSLLGDEEMNERFGKAARAYVQQHHSYDNIAKQYETIYTQLLDDTST